MWYNVPGIIWWYTLSPPHKLQMCGYTLHFQQSRCVLYHTGSLYDLCNSIQNAQSILHACLCMRILLSAQMRILLSAQMSIKHELKFGCLTTQYTIILPVSLLLCHTNFVTGLDQIVIEMEPGLSHTCSYYNSSNTRMQFLQTFRG